jgi:alanine racemase
MAREPRFRPTVARVDLGALRHNHREVRRRLASTGCAVLAPVKADAYGHGLVPVARTLADEGVDWFGVALLEEGLELRANGIDCPILVLGGLPDGSEVTAADAGLTPVVYRSPSVRALNAIAARRQMPIGVHLKVDTGMNRLGVPVAELSAFLDLLDGMEHVYIDGLMTHLAVAESEDPTFTVGQLRAFAGAIDAVRARGHHPRWIHAANSAGMMTNRSLPAPHAANLARPGIALFGVPPDAALAGAWDLRPVMSFESAITYLKDIPAGARVSYGLTWGASRPTRLATLPVGYGDGYLRVFGNRGHVLVRGHRAPVVGRVCMDLCMVDVTDVPGVQEGDRAILLGRQGDEEISAVDLAAHADTIPYEILCTISPRVPRLYHGRDGG